MIAAWPSANGDEYALAFDQGRAARLLVLPALFDEANKTRHLAVETMRRLDGAGIEHLVLDRNMSVLEGSLGILPRRILVPDDKFTQARRVMQDAGLGNELRSDTA